MGSTKSKFFVDIMSLHDGVTGSCNLAVVKHPELGTFKFAVDCGYYQESKYNELNYELPFNPDELDCVFVTHNHIDHTGRIPMLVAQGFEGRIYLTNTTRAFLPAALADSRQHMAETATKDKKKPIYNEIDLYKTSTMLTSVEYGKTVKINEFMKATFYMNGHLPGAAIILIQIFAKGEESINLLFTGDYAPNNAFFKVKSLPRDVKKLRLTVIQESTYGTTESSDIVPCFKKNIENAVLQGKSIVIPAFSLGRSQEVMYILRQMQDEKLIPDNYPIYIDGKLLIHYTELYMKGLIDIDLNEEDFMPKNWQFVHSESMRFALRSSKSPQIVITSSGMGSNGPAKDYIPACLENSNGYIHFTGYAAEGTMARRLLDTLADNEVFCAGRNIVKRARVDFTSELSKHAKADEMIKFLNGFADLRLVLVNHGEENVREEFADRIEEDVCPREVRILNRKKFYRVGPYGLIKEGSSKFDS